MSDSKQIPSELHREQIEQYEAERDHYLTYAEVLKRVLEEACAAHIPEAVVQARAKAPSSFAEKGARKYAKYKDPVRQFTDLCGARVLVQTLGQVRSVCRFVERSFHVHEKDDKALSLGEETFGYRDMHYVVSLAPDLCESLGVTPDEQARIAHRKAEIQVRTWLQHAWADTLHDRVYKNPLTLPRRMRRLGALQAALMEEGDRNFNEMADVLDGMIANYGASAEREEVEREIEVQRLLLENEPRHDRKPPLALKLARMHAACGAWDEVADVLAPHEDHQGPDRCDLLSELGYARCRLARARPESPRYEQGRTTLESAVQWGSAERPFVVDLRRSKSSLARAHHRLAWALEAVSGKKPQAREHYQRAHETEPGNPYYLASMLGFELAATRQLNLLVPMRGAIREAIATCRGHALAAIELPWAHFTAGRLGLLLDLTGKEGAYEAFGHYALGMSHVLEGRHCVPGEVVEEEMTWLRELSGGEPPSPASRWVMEMLELGGRVVGSDPGSESPREALIIAGGAASMDPEVVENLRPILEVALESFTGRVISGGTRSGVPGCVGAVAADLQARDAKRFDLIAYIPRHLPHDAPRDERYDRHVPCGSGGFSPEQPLKTWSDLLDAGVRPGDVTVLGLGGGRISAAEYRLALALGASVGIVTGTGGTADELLRDELWADSVNLLPIPQDIESVRALVAPPISRWPPDVIEQMAMHFHQGYLELSTGKLPPALRTWPDLPETFKIANREQARHTERILREHGFGVRRSSSPSVFRLERSDPRVRRMAEAEHGRWNIERLRQGWRYGPRDDERKRHPLIVPWEDVPDEIREYDLNAVLRFPEILAEVGLEVYDPDEES